MRRVTGAPAFPPAWRRRREVCWAGARVSSSSGSLGGRRDRWAGVGGDVAVLVVGLVQVQRPPVDLQRHAAAVECCDGGRGHRHLWPRGKDRRVSVGGLPIVWGLGSPAPMACWVPALLQGMTVPAGPPDRQALDSCRLHPRPSRKCTQTVQSLKLSPPGPVTHAEGFQALSSSSKSFVY